MPQVFMGHAVICWMVVRRNGAAMLRGGAKAGFGSRNSLQGHRNDEKGSNDEATPAKHGGYCISRKPEWAQSRAGAAA
jgi:hypothetical protein